MCPKWFCPSCQLLCIIVKNISLILLEKVLKCGNEILKWKRSFTALVYVLFWHFLLLIIGRFHWLAADLLFMLKWFTSLFRLSAYRHTHLRLCTVQFSLSLRSSQSKTESMEKNNCCLKNGFVFFSCVFGVSKIPLI